MNSKSLWWVYVLIVYCFGFSASFGGVVLLAESLRSHFFLLLGSSVASVFFLFLGMGLSLYCAQKVEGERGLRST